VLLQGYMSQRTKAPFTVEYAMRSAIRRYPPMLRKLKEQNCQRILVVPMYRNTRGAPPRRSPTSSFASAQMRNTAAIRTIKHFHDHPGYIKALAGSVNDYWMMHGRRRSW